MARSASHALPVLLLLALPTPGQTGAARRVDPVASLVPGEVLVCPQRGWEARVAGGVAASGLTVLETDAASGVLRVAVPAGEETTWVALFGAWGDVDYAERNGVGQGGLAPDDTHYFRQWHLANTGLFGGTPGADIEAEGAWELTTGSSDVVVAVLDTGIDSDHPEFAGRIDPDGFDFVNEDSDPEADHPHGTWVSGSLGANANNGFGVAGVDWGCRILPIKVLDAANRGTTFDLAQGLNYCAAQADVRVISMSLINYPLNRTLLNALRNARGAGKVLMACAGNGGIGNADVSYPGAAFETISIGATTRTDSRAAFSGTGSRLDFVAPGAAIVTTRQGSFADTFSTVSGCSFATPISSGIVGLLLALADERGLSLDQDAVYDLLRAGAEDQVGSPAEDVPGRDPFHGHGRLNALRTLQALPLVLTLDVRPGSCVNPLQVRSRGRLPVALLGTDAADLALVDVASLRLARADGTGGEVAPILGSPGPSPVLADVATPDPADPGACPQAAPDGFLDLELKFDTREVVEVLELGALSHRASVELVLRGVLTTGPGFEARDAIRLLLAGRASSTGLRRP